MTDPTPRTAATAREALEAICAAHYNDPDGGMGYTSAGYGTFETACVVCGTSDEYAVEWPCWTWTTANAGLIALAAAEAPDRVAALEAAGMRAARDAHAAWLRAGIGQHTPTLIEECPNEWCREHVAALAAPAPPAGVSGEVCWCGGGKTNLRHLRHDEARKGHAHHGTESACHAFDPAPAPTPSEPVERCRACGHEAARHRPDTCASCDGLDGPHTGICTGYQPTPATRDE